MADDTITVVRMCYSHVRDFAAEQWGDLPNGCHFSAVAMKLQDDELHVCLRRILSPVEAKEFDK